MTLSDIFWALVSIALFLMLIVTICFAVICFDQEIQADRAKRPKPQEIDKELQFPELSYWEMNRALYNVRKTDKMIRKYRRKYYYAGYGR